MNELNPTALGPNRTLPTNTANPTYAYTLTQDPNGNQSMNWKNGFGQVEQTAAVKVDAAGMESFVVTQNLYDQRGNVIRILPPMSCQNRDGTPSGIPNCVEPTSYTYDGENRLVEEKSPDHGVTRYFYDKVGQNRITQSAEQAKNHRLSVQVYDEFDRLKYTGEYLDLANQFATPALVQAQAENTSWPAQDAVNFTPLAVYFYDSMPDAIPPELDAYNQAHGRKVRLYPDIESRNFGYTKGRLCAVITFQKEITGLPSNINALIEPFSTAAYRYDKYGRVTTSFTYNGFLTDPDYKLQRAENVYDASGRVVQTLNYDRSKIPSPSKVANFVYNASGSLLEIRDVSGKALATYSYYPTTNKVKTIKITKDNDLSTSVSYLYDISGGIKSIDAVRNLVGNMASQPLYTQDLFYDIVPPGSGAVPQFNGNIAATEYNFDAGNPGSRMVEYQYDKQNRMLRALYELEDGVTNEKEDRFDEAITYDDNGRIKSMWRGSKASVVGGGEYTYQTGKNQLAYVVPGMDGQASPRVMGGSLTSPNFSYDADGRMVYHRSKNLQVEYDFRGLPLTFNYTGATQRFKVVQRYEHTGSRIAKLLLTQSGTSTFGQVLVDPDASRDRDYPSLAEAMVDLTLKIAPLTKNPGTVKINAVPDAEGYVDLSGMNAIHALPFQGGEAGFEITGIYPGTKEYNDLSASRHGGQTLVNSTAYTNVGNEIRQEFTGTAVTTKVLTNLPMGLGRYNADGSRLYYLKDNLGNTKVSFQETGAAGAKVFDYFPYGKQEELSSGAVDKITETFTGKELDDEEKFISGETAFAGLYYFGARYYDPELGIWVSQDPVRGNDPSPYAYCNNDPINKTDPDGRNPILQEGVVLAEEAIVIARIEGPILADKIATRAQATIDVTKMVLGKFPTDVNMAKELGVKAFSIPPRIWNTMSPAAQAAANAKSIDRVVQREGEFLLSNNPQNATGAFGWELQMMYEKYGLVPNAVGDKLKAP